MAKDAKEKDEPPQAQPGDTGMEKRDMKKLLKRSQSEPVSCAIAQGDAKSGGPGLILMDKIRLPKELVRELKEKFPTMRTPAFGTASVDVEADAKLVTFKMNKRIPGLDRRVRKSLKGTGYSKVSIELAGIDDDGEDDAV